MRAWQVQSLGDPWEVLEPHDIEPLTPRADTLVVAVEASDLNFADILQCQGKYQVKLSPPFTPGMGTAGRVLAAGEQCQLRPGDRVVGPTAYGCGGYAEQALVLESQATVLRPDVSGTQAVATHVTYGTAWFGLFHRGNLQPGESVLVLAAAGGVGAAAVDLAKLHGCWVVAAASGAKQETCQALGADAFVDYDADDFYAQVMALTDGRGVDVVYDPVGGRYFEVARRLVAWEGRYLVIGFASGDIPSAALNHALVKNYSIVGVHMGGYRQHDDGPFETCYEALYEWLAQGRITPLISEHLGFNDLPQGLLALYERRSTGRIVFEPGR